MPSVAGIAPWWRPVVLAGLVAGLVAAACPAKDAVSPNTPTQVVIAPLSVTLHAGQQATFHAWGKSSAGDSMAASISFSATGGSITSQGVYTASSNIGTYHVVATLGSGKAADTASVSITLIPVASVAVTPADPSIPSGTTVGLTAIMRDSNTNVLTGRAVTWSSGTTSVGTVDANGIVTGVSAGTTIVTATSEGVHGKDTVTVTTPTATLVRINLTPDSTSVVTGHAVQFNVLGTFSDSSTATVPATYSPTGGTISSGGLYTAGSSAGSYRVIATAAGGHADTSKVTVLAPTLVRVLLTPDSVHLDTGATQQFSVSGKFSDSSTNTISATYAVTGGSMSPGGLYTAGTTVGSFHVIATSGGLADTSKVTIAAPTLVRVVLTPDSAQVDTGHTQQFSVVGKFSDSSTNTISATYAVTGGSMSPGGLYTAGTTVGSFHVIATSGGLADTSYVVVVATAASTAAECAAPGAGWIWCDDFEQDRTTSYYETSSASGNFTRVAGVGFGGSYGMKAHFTPGAVDLGYLHVAFGKTPDPYFKAVDAGTANYRELYWRVYVMNQAGWVGGGAYKLDRALVFANSNWAEAAFAHVWSGDQASTLNYLLLDPARGTDSAGNLVTTTYNDFPNMTWLGAVPSKTAIFDAGHVGAWHCVEAHAKLNDAGSSNGVFEMWIDGNLEAQETGMNWVGSFSAYGFNAVFLENYWNTGAPTTEDRFLDRLVVSTQRIGC